MSKNKPIHPRHETWPNQVSISLDDHMEHARMIIEEARQGEGESAWYELYNLILNFNSLRGNHAHGGRVSVWPQPYLYRFLPLAVARAIDEAREDYIFKAPATRSTATSLVRLDSNSTSSLSAIVTPQSHLSSVESTHSVSDAPSARRDDSGSEEGESKEEPEAKDLDTEAKEQAQERRGQGGEAEAKKKQRESAEDGEDKGHYPEVDESDLEESGHESAEEKEDDEEAGEEAGEDEEENDIPFTAEEAQFRVPDFLVILTRAISDSSAQFRNALIFWELKYCQGYESATMFASNEQIHRKAQIMRATIPQLVQQAQFLFQHFPEQNTAIGMIAVGLLFRVHTFHRNRMPALPQDGKLKLLPKTEAAKILTISAMYQIYNEKGTDYSTAFKFYWTISRTRAAEMEGGS